jgi:integrase
MATDFAVFLRRVLTTHLAGLRGCSPNTVASYRDTFKLLIVFFRDDRAIPPEKLTLDRIDAAAVTGFLNWLEVNRHNSVSTRNQRLAAISSFSRWMQTQDPTQLARCQDILAIPAKRQPQPAVNHLTVEQTRRLLAQPDRSTRPGRRDATLLATLYDTAARVQELADLTVRDVRLHPPALGAFPGPEYYDGSAPSQPVRPTMDPTRPSTPDAWTARRTRTVPVFTVIRSTKEEPDFVPAASPRLPRSTSPWPPGDPPICRPRVPRNDIAAAGARRSQPISTRFEPVRF